MPSPSDRIVFERSQAKQGQSVVVEVFGGEQERKAGTLVLTFGEWIHFSKLLKDASERAKRQGDAMVEVVIRGKLAEESRPAGVKAQTLLAPPPVTEIEPETGDEPGPLVRSLL